MSEVILIHIHSQEVNASVCKMKSPDSLPFLYNKPLKLGY